MLIQESPNHPKAKGSGLDDYGRDIVFESEEKKWVAYVAMDSHEGSHLSMREPKSEEFKRGALSQENHVEIEHKF